MGLKELYYSIEDKYYNVLDGIEKFFPIYKIIDPIDKVFPSFILFIVIVLALIGFVLIPVLVPGNSNVTVNFIDSEGKAKNLDVILTVKGETLSKNTGEEGRIALEVPLNSSITIKVENENYESYQKTIEVKGKEFAFTVQLQKKELSPQAFTLIFSYNGQKITGKAITVRLSCANGFSLPQSTVNDPEKDGEIEVTKPNECDLLTATAKIGGFEDNTKTLIESVETFEMEEIASQLQDKGKITVIATNEEGKKINGVTVTLRDEYDSFEGEDQTANGTVTFEELDAGTYSVTLQDDANGIYETKRVEGITVSAGKETKEAVELQRKTYTITATAFEKNSSNKIANATINLKDALGKIIASKTTGSNGSPVSFSFSAGGNEPALIEARAEGFLPARKSIKGETQDVSLYLEAATPENSGKVHIQVLDKDGKVVENARVMLMDAETKGLAPYEPLLSNSDGNADYTGIAAGQYYVIAQKGRAEGKSETKEIDVGEENYFTVTIDFGFTEISFYLVDEEGTALTGAGGSIEIRDSFDSSLMTEIPVNPEGKTSAKLKADRTVYFIAKKEGYAKRQTVPLELVKDKKIELKIELRKPWIGEKPVIELRMFDSKGNELQANTLEQEQEYNAVLTVILPKNELIKKAGLFFMTGNEVLVENDNIYIKGASVSGAVIFKGGSWNKDEWAKDQKALTNDNAKWFTATWDNASSGIYDALVRIRIKNASIARDGDLAGVHYNAWYSTSNKTFREPEDSAAKLALYAKTHDPEFYIGGTPKCYNDICISEQKILNIKNDIYELKPFNLMVNGSFTYSFTLTNLTDKVYQNAELQIESDELIEFSEYDVQGDQEIKGNAQGKNSIQGVSVGEFRKFKAVKVKANFSTKDLGATQIKVRLLDTVSKEYVFQETLGLKIKSSNQLRLSVEPEEIHSFVVTPVTATITDEEGTEQKGAIVTAKKQLGSGEKQTIKQRLTDNLGKAFFTIPSSSPKTKIIIEARKYGFEPAVQTIIVDENVLGIEPKKIETELDSIDVKEITVPLTLTSRIGIPLEITQVKLTGEFKGLLRNTQMQNFLDQFRNAPLNAIEPLKDKEIQFKAVINEGAVTKAETLKGNLLIEVYSEDMDAYWTFAVPIAIKVSPGPGLEERDCLSLDLVNWNTYAAPGIKEEAPFSLSNECVSGQNNTPIPLKNLRVQLKLDSGSNLAGVFSMSLNSNLISWSSELKNNKWNNVAEELRDEATYGVLNGTISFTPFFNSVKELQEKATIIFEAEALTENGTEKITKEMKADIKVLNLKQCISFDPEEIEFEDREMSKNLTVKNNCSDTINLRLCKDDDGCGTGSERIKFSGYYPSEPELSIDPNSSKALTIKREASTPLGAYGIKFEAKKSGDSGLFYTEISRVKVNLKGKYYFEDPFLTLNNFKANTVLKSNIVGPGSFGVFSDHNPVLDLSWEEKLKFLKRWGINYPNPNPGICSQALNAYKQKYEGTGKTTNSTLFLEEILKDKKKRKNTAEFSTAKFVAPVVVAAIIAAAVAVVTAVIEAWGNDIYDGIAKSLGGGTKFNLEGFFVPWYNGCNQYNNKMVFVPENEAKQDVRINTKAMDLAVNPYDLSGDRYYYKAGAYYSLSSHLTGEMKFEWTISCLTGYELIESPVIDQTHHGKRCDAPIDYSINNTNDAVTFTLTCHGKAFRKVWWTQETWIACRQKPEMWDEKGRIPVQFTLDDAQLKKEIEKGKPVYVQFNLIPNSTLYGTGTQIRAGKMRIELSNPVREELPKIDLGREACSSTLREGRNGSNAVPRIGLAKGIGWKFGEIKYNSCDQDNQNYIYCDSAQFSIELLERIEKVREWLKANNESFSCPKNQANIIANQQKYYSEITGGEELSGEVPSGSIGLSDFSVSAATMSNGIPTTNAIVEVQNNTGAIQDVNAIISIANPSINFSQQCKKEINGILSAGTVYEGEEVEGVDGANCNFENLPVSDENYTAKVQLQSNAPMNPSAAEIKFKIRQSEKVEEAGCWFGGGSTVKKGGYFIPDIWLNKNGLLGESVTQETINWTEDIKNLEDLKKMTHFNAYLIKDGFSEDFQKDFHEYFTKTNFADTPSWYYNDTSDNLGAYFPDPNLFSYTIEDSSDLKELNEPGLHQVDIEISFNDGWKFFDSQGNPNGAINIALHKIKDEEPKSAFYYLPFDGEIGLKGDNYDRQGYGTAYSNNLIDIVNEPITQIHTHSSEGSNALMSLDIQKNNSIQQLNSDLSQRGNLLSINSLSGNSMQLTFSPSIATPVLFKATAKQTSQLKAFYKLLYQENAAEAEDTLGLWAGARNQKCLDLDGTPLYVLSKPDSRAGQEDTRIGVSLKNYKVQWDTVTKVGSTWYTSLFFTPPGENYILSSTSPLDQMKFYTLQSKGIQVSLNGVPGLSSNSETSKINSIARALQLVKEGKACIADNGLDVDLWWDEKSLYEAKGSDGKSIWDLEQGLSPNAQGEFSCIGGS
ncbi:MAG: carboxypeptidase-like regulatory domain-containing protein [Candidatus Diapherotrites archaeon]